MKQQARPREQPAPRAHLKCQLASKPKPRQSFWLYAGNHVEPEEEIRNRALSHARGSDSPQKPALLSTSSGCHKKSAQQGGSAWLRTSRAVGERQAAAPARAARRAPARESSHFFF